MKLNKLFLAGAIALGLVACKNEVPNVETDVLGKGNAFAGMSISTKGAELKAAPVQKDENGRTAESAVASIDLLSNKTSKTWTTFTDPVPATYPVDGATFFMPSAGNFTVSPWKTEAGMQNMALLLNGADLAAKGDIATAAEFVAKDAIAKFSTESKFVMSSKTFSGNVLAGIKKETIEVKTNTANVFEQNVERVVCQGVVTSTLGANPETVDKAGKLSDLKYGGAMGAKETYLYADKAGDRTMTGTPLDYQGYTSAVHAVAVSATEPTDFTTVDGQKFAKAETTDLVLATEASPYANRGFYFLENSMALPGEDNHTDWKYTRSAYAKVYGVFTPAKVYTFDKWQFTAKAGTGKYYDPATGESKNQADGGQEGEVKAVLKVKDDYATGQDFFKGEKDGVFYDSSANAKLSPSYPDQKSYMYEKGRVVYRTLWNRVMNADDTKTLNGNTRRNNIYVLNVTEFAGVGLNYDPNDPTDPNIPQPKNPDEPVTPPDGGDPTVDKQETYMRVSAKVLPWNKVSRDIKL